MDALEKDKRIGRTCPHDETERVIFETDRGTHLWIATWCKRCGAFRKEASWEDGIWSYPELAYHKKVLTD